MKMTIKMERNLFFTIQFLIIFLIYSNTNVYISALLGPIRIRCNKTSRLHYNEDLQESLAWKFRLPQKLTNRF